MSRGIFGGTFDVLHDGHRALLNTAFREADDWVTIGVTSDEKANEARERDVNPYWERIENLHDVASSFRNIYDTDFSTTEITDNYQLAIDVDADFIVLSPEQKTHERAAKINLERIREGKERLQIIEAPMVEDWQGRKISSTNIVNNEIDIHGHKK